MRNSGRAYAGDTSDFLGVAPDARIVNVKVADESGAVDVSQVLAGIDWVVQHRNDSRLNIRVLNLSFGTNSLQSYILDPLAFAAEIAWKSGIVVVASAGNNGAASNGLSDPAYDPFLIAVGAADTQGSLNMANHTVAALLEQRHQHAHPGPRRPRRAHREPARPGLADRPRVRVDGDRRQPVLPRQRHLAGRGRGLRSGGADPRRRSPTRPPTR